MTSVADAVIADMDKVLEAKNFAARVKSYNVYSRGSVDGSGWQVFTAYTMADAQRVATFLGTVEYANQGGIQPVYTISEDSNYIYSEKDLERLKAKFGNELEVLPD